MLEEVTIEVKLFNEFLPTILFMPVFVNLYLFSPLSLDLHFSHLDTLPMEAWRVYIINVKLLSFVHAISQVKDIYLNSK